MENTIIIDIVKIRNAKTATYSQLQYAESLNIKFKERYNDNSDIDMSRSKITKVVTCKQMSEIIDLAKNNNNKQIIVTL